jgi:hypothetical protein
MSNNITAERIVERVEQTLHDDGIGFAMEGARVYNITMDTDGTTPNIGGFVESADIYDLLESPDAGVIALLSDFVVIATTGWAAPADDLTVAPSQHSERRRVRLVIVANRNSVASVLRFSDDPTDTVVDYGSAEGSLADAVLRFTSVMGG